MTNRYGTLFEPLAWQRLPVHLKNTRNVYAKEPPASIMESIFKETMEKALGKTGVPYFFHSLDSEPLPERVQKKQTYSLELVLASNDPEQALSFIKALEMHLEDPCRNFALINTPVPEQRCFNDLWELVDRLSGEKEVCLEFITPLSITPRYENKPWWVSEEIFFNTFSDRISALFDIPLPIETGELEGISVLPYYWHYENRLKHRAKSSSGIRYINGNVGPLYVKGDIQKIAPLVAVCSELHAGRSLPYGRGFFKIRKPAPFFDRKLISGDWLEQTLSEIEHTNDFDDKAISDQGFNRPDLAAAIQSRMSDPGFCPEPAKAFDIPKKQGGSRRIVMLGHDELILQKVLAALLTPVLNKMFEPSAIGFRPGRSRESVKKMLTQACREGYTHVLETDIEAFFDHIDWAFLFEKLELAIPSDDTITLELVRQAVKMSVVMDGETVERAEGLLQGSPLSPLLSNLYLDSFDEQLHMAGLKHARYGDDLIVFLKSRETGEYAREKIEQILEPFHLTLKVEKTQINRMDCGFSYLGQSLGFSLEEEVIEAAAFRKPLFIRPIYAFLGVDGDSLVVKKNSQLVSRVPIHRISELVVLGSNTVSTTLLTRCSHEKIPVSFCSPSGYHINTLFNDTQAGLDFLYSHTDRFNQVHETEKIRIAIRLVDSKINNYLKWIKKRYGRDSNKKVRMLKDLLVRLETSESLEAVQGYEGRAAAVLFSYVNEQINPEYKEFLSDSRVKHKKADHYNSLLDFAYFLLSTRVNTLVRSRGLNPFLGFLHSHKNHYESLVWDLMEPFRYRMDRMVVKLINRKTIQADDFEMSLRKGKKNGLRLTGEGVGKFIEGFESEFHTRFKTDSASLLQLITAQVALVAAWVRTGQPLIFFESGVEGND